MEPLVFALIACRNGYKQEESFVPQADDFQPFDVRTLVQAYNARKEGLTGNRKENQRVATRFHSTERKSANLIAVHV